MASADLQGKYQKLAQEYSKLRAQNQVLKKAVVDEQANSSALKEQLKMKDQSLRKQQQEMDSLTFRNQQLAKRVELLQEELSVMETKGKKSKKNMEPSQLSHEQKSVFDEDLHKKIEENERLHIQFFEASEKHKLIETELRNRLQVLESSAAQHQAVVDGLTQKYMETIEKLQGDKAKLEVKSQTLEKEAKDCRLHTEECQNQLKTLHADLSGRLDESLSVINEKLPFNDTKTSTFNALNVPLHNRRHQIKARELAAQALAFVQDLVTALLNFHTYTEQRVQIFPIDSAIDVISPLNKKFSQYLHENASYVRPLEEGMIQLFESIREDTVTVLETTVKLKVFSEHFASYVCFLQKILPYQLKSLEEECEFSLCTPSLRETNLELHRDMKKLTAVFDKLKTYISLLALPSISPEGLLKSNYSSILTQISDSLHGLHDIMKEISKHYNHKASLEQELPAATDKLKTTNDCILSSLVALTNGTSKMATFFSNNLDYFMSSLSYGPKAGHGFIHPLSAEMMLQYKKRMAKYMKALKKIGMLTSSTESLQVPDHESREDLIKSHYMSRIAELTNQLQVADSKCVHFYAECRALAKRLALADKSNQSLTEETRSTSQSISRLQDELITTKRSYEDQLSMMSDHLCSMNETLSKQREEIDNLKMANKGNLKKNKNR
ncbi:protein phosphatase 1 regulatory subunit 21 [Bombina bombina]|uniref:protein phosphatase 1 regulatory subunit 21 n=1 Tax=Bombina bombina TaxID=8345 RepID=UPI00235A6B1D|nr:protein phosphatase 1 regulatory subunit 21 [Bombina bombina]